MLDTLPDPLLSVTVPVVVLPSPQFQLAVWVSETSASVNDAEAVMAVLIKTGDEGAVIVPTVGGNTAFN